MAAPLSNKQIAVLQLLRAEGELSCTRISGLMEERTPCGECDGTGKGDGRFGCRRCHGLGHALFSYGAAYAALKALRAGGLVTRRNRIDEWGDATADLVWSALPVEVPDDPLEAAFHAPTVEGRTP
jgi:hypothetical protein